MTELLSVSVAIIAGLLLTRVVKPLHLPDVTAFLVTGVLIGPYCLGALGIPGLGFNSMEEISLLTPVSNAALGFIAFAIGNEFRLTELKKTGNSEMLVSMRNVAGEIAASVMAMRYALDNGYEQITIFHDYEGIAKWCTGEWKTEKDGTKKYKQFFDSVKSRIKVSFVKVAAHTGVEYNELADKLAKDAAEIQ